MSDKVFTKAEFDEFFKDDPAFQEAKRRLAAIEVRRLLHGDSKSDDTLQGEQKDLADSARRAVHSVLYPEKV